MKYKINEALLNVIRIKNGHYPSKDLESAVSDAIEIIFNETCSKHYLDHCQPEYCIFRSNNMCEYFAEFEKLKTILKSKN